MKNFKNGINEFKARNNYTLKELGDKLGVSGGLVGNWCQGRGVPSFELVKKLFCLGMTLKEMFGGDFQNIGLLDLEKSNGDIKEVSKQDVKSFLLNLDASEFYKFIEIVQDERLRKKQLNVLVDDLGYSKEDALKFDKEFYEGMKNFNSPEFQKLVHDEIEKVIKEKKDFNAPF